MAAAGTFLLPQPDEAEVAACADVPLNRAFEQLRIPPTEYRQPGIRAKRVEACRQQVCAARQQMIALHGCAEQAA
jgi:hypothetical protein